MHGTPTLLLLLLLPSFSAPEPTWWKLIHLSSDRSSRTHTKYWKHLLDSRQRKIVRRQENLLGIFSSALKDASKECQRVFKDHKWNCTIGHTFQSPVFGPITNKACRETAFLYALISAAAVRAVAKACSDGALSHCSCDPQKRGPTVSGWEWKGCSDNIPYGVRISRRFIDSAERGADLRTAMNKHNNEAGRAHAKATAKNYCHGMYGKTEGSRLWCRRTVGRMNAVSSRLFRRFHKAARLAHLNESPVSRRRRHLVPRKRDLVYLEDSPDFCRQKDRRTGHSLLSGRQCNNTDPIRVDYCKSFCCHGYYRKTEEVTTTCNCSLVTNEFKFYKVLCQPCNFIQENYYCN